MVCRPTDSTYMCIYQDLHVTFIVHQLAFTALAKVLGTKVSLVSTDAKNTNYWQCFKVTLELGSGGPQLQIPSILFVRPYPNW